MNKQTIWMEKQNKPILIVRDLKENHPEISEEEIFEILLRRGVFKWLAVRRDLIRYKNILKDEVRRLNQLDYRTDKEKGRLNTIIEIRKQLRKLCHSERWRAPDNDRHAQKYLEELGV